MVLHPPLVQNCKSLHMSMYINVLPLLLGVNDLTPLYVCKTSTAISKLLVGILQITLPLLSTCTTYVMDATMTAIKGGLICMCICV